MASSAYLASASEIQSVISTKVTIFPNIYFEEIMVAPYDTLPAIFDPLPAKQSKAYKP